MLTRRRVAAAVVLLSTALAGTPALVSSAQAAPDRSDRAVARAADRYGVSESSLEARLRTDPGFRLTSSGVALNIDPAHAGKTRTTGLLGQAFPLPDTFKLHSKPGSKKTIYLDFNGQDVSGTVWNTDFDGPANPGVPVPSGAHPAMDLAGNGASFTGNELLQVQDIFQRVAEDYSPYDVDVTTEEPAAASLDRTNAGDQVYGTRALISPSTGAAAAICQSTCGGVAFIGVFNHYAGAGSPTDPTSHDGYQPAWIFPQLLTSGNQVKNIAEATTHEVGHNLGLDHDATNSAGYYEGHNGWAPIMGAGYSQPIVQFALNDYPDADLGGPGPGSAQSNPDDFATIASFGPAFRTDEPGTSTGNAGPVPTGSAYISSRTDVDYFALGTCSGTVAVQANNAPVSPDLDIQLQLVNASNSALATDDPASGTSGGDVATGLDAAVSASSLPSGRYYARVDGVGRGTALNGYTDYGSVGAYTLTVTGCGGVVPGDGPPSAPLNLSGDYQGDGNVKLAWDPPADEGGADVTQYNIYLDDDENPLGDVPPAPANHVLVTNVRSGVHDFWVSAVNSEGEGPQAHVSVDTSDNPRAKPGKPRIGAAKPGKRGGKLTATVRWLPPSGTTNPRISGYVVVAYRENKHGKFVTFSTSPLQGPNVGSISFTTNTKARLKFAVKARNSLGYGRPSSKSNAVRPR